MKKLIVMIFIILSLTICFSNQSDYFFSKEDVVVNIDGVEALKPATLKRYFDGRIVLVELVNNGRIPCGTELDVWAEISTTSGKIIENDYPLSIIVRNNEIIYIED